MSNDVVYFLYCGELKCAVINAGVLGLVTAWNGIFNIVLVFSKFLKGTGDKIGFCLNPNNLECFL